MENHRKLRVLLIMFFIFSIAILSTAYIYLSPNERVKIIEEEDNSENVLGQEVAEGIPYIVSLPPIVGYEGQEYEYLVRVVTMYEERALSLEYIEGPEWLRVEDMTLKGIPPYGSSGSYKIGLRVSDGYNSSVQEEYIVIEGNEITEDF